MADRAGDLAYDRAFALLTGSQAMSVADGEGPPPDMDMALGPDGLELKKFYWGARPFNAARHVEACMATGAPLRVLCDSPVTELVEASDGAAVAAAHVHRRDGGVTRVEAKVFILAAGGIETPRILLSSTGRHPAGIGNGNDLVGRFLSTHPKADIATLTLSRRVALGHPLFSDCASGSGRARLGLGFGAGAQRHLGLLNHYVQLSPFLEYRASRIFEAMRTSSVITSPLIDKSKFVRGLLPSLGLFVFETIGRIAGLQGRARSFILRGFLDQYPNPDNRVRLSGELNALGLPTADLVWKFSQQDRESVLRFLGTTECFG